MEVLPELSKSRSLWRDWTSNYFSKEEAPGAWLLVERLDAFVDNKAILEGAHKDGTTGGWFFHAEKKDDDEQQAVVSCLSVASGAPLLAAHIFQSQDSDPRFPPESLSSEGLEDIAAKLNQTAADMALAAAAMLYVLYEHDA